MLTFGNFFVSEDIFIKFKNFFKLMVKQLVGLFTSKKLLLLI